MTTTTASAEIQLYLRQLDRASRWLPAAQAAELREQVASHLHDALPDDADDAEVSAVLAELGEPAALAREAGGDARRRLRTRVRRVRLRTWLICAIVLGALGTATGLIAARLLPEYYASDLRCGCGFGLVATDGGTWRFVQLADLHGVELDARPGRQGFVFDLGNASDVDQQILGFAPGSEPWGDQPGVYRLSIGTTNELSPLENTRFAGPPITVPAGKRRDIRVEWDHLACHHDPNLTRYMAGISLRVRIGSFTRTEDIALPGDVILRSTKTC